MSSAASYLRSAVSSWWSDNASDIQRETANVQSRVVEQVEVSSHFCIGLKQRFHSLGPLSVTSLDLGSQRFRESITNKIVPMSW